MISAPLSSDSILNKISKKTSIVKIFPEGKNITNEQATLISSLSDNGVYLVYDNKRYYPYNELLAHSIGFTGTKPCPKFTGCLWLLLCFSGRVK